jgi:succinate dehydrogenase/fumarate reductase flavoprotein subunit
MAQEVGASLWHMNQMTGRAILSFPTAEGRLNFRPKLSPPGYVMVDRDGNRFVNEDEYSLHSFYYSMIPFDGQRGEYPRIPSYWIFDERRRQAGPLTITEMGLCSVGLYDWSYDNMKEIEAGWIHRGRTVSEAAAKAGARDPEAVQKAVATYNGACEAKEDSNFHRPSESLVPLDSPPFYCVELWPGGANTSGGPRRDGAARVLDVNGSPIPGLFAAGELGQAIGLLYPAGGANISDALCFGRIAARTALAAQRP